MPLGKPHLLSRHAASVNISIAMTADIAASHQRTKRHDADYYRIAAETVDVTFQRIEPFPPAFQLTFKYRKSQEMRRFPGTFRWRSGFVNPMKTRDPVPEVKHPNYSKNCEYIN